MKLTRESEEVLYSAESIVVVDNQDIEDLKQAAMRNRRKRIRLCTHPSVEDPLHEMIIVHHLGCYVRPHRHAGKSESYHIVEGNVDIVLFEDTGVLLKIIHLGTGSEFVTYYRLNEPVFHTVIHRSEVVVFHETTNGPFRRSDTEFADWAPEESDSAEVATFLSEIDCKVNEFEKV